MSVKKVKTFTIQSIRRTRLIHLG